MKFTNIFFISVRIFFSYIESGKVKKHVKFEKNAHCVGLLIDTVILQREKLYNQSNIVLNKGFVIILGNSHTAVTGVAREDDSWSYPIYVILCKLFWHTTLEYGKNSTR